MRMLLGSPVFWALVSLGCYALAVLHCKNFEQKNSLHVRADIVAGMPEAEAKARADQRFGDWSLKDPLSLALNAGWVCGFVAFVITLFRSF